MWSSVLRSKEINHYEAVSGFFIGFKCYTMLKLLLLILKQLKLLFLKMLQAILHILFSTPYEIIVHKKMKETICI